nr:hypothetical protein [Tanacetum cinerariifolium]
MILFPSRTAMLSIFMFISMPYMIARAICVHDYDMLSPSHGEGRYINALASFVGTMLMMVKIVHHKFLISKLCQVFHNNIRVVKIVESSVENLVPNPSESEDLSDSECDVPACGDFTSFSNFLFDADDDFSSSDNESFSDEDISKKIYSNPLFDEEIISIMIDPHSFNAESYLIESLLNHDSLIISSSSKIDSLLDEFAGELILLKTIPSRIDETDYDPEEEIRLIEKLLYDNSSPRPPGGFISKNFDAAIESFSPSPIPVEDSHYFMEEIDLSFTSDDPMPLGIEEDDYDSKREEKASHILSHRGFKASQLHSEGQMMIYEGNTPILDVLFLYFYPP